MPVCRAELLHVPRVASAQGSSQAWAAPSNPHIFNNSKAPRACEFCTCARVQEEKGLRSFGEGNWERGAPTPSSSTVPAGALRRNGASTTKGYIPNVGQEDTESGMETTASCKETVIKNKCS